MSLSLSGSSLWEVFAWTNTPRNVGIKQSKVTNLGVKGSPL